MSAFSTPAAGERPRRRIALVGSDWAFIALLGLAAVVVILETRGMSFFGDDWDFVVDRRGLAPPTLLRPHGPHLVVIPILVYKVLLQVFGGGSYLPFRLLAAFDLVVTALVLGIACRDRWGRWWGLAPVVLLVTLGAAGVSTLWSFQDGYALAMAFGLLALVALDRGGRWADATACVSLVLSLGSGSQGVGFVVGVAFMIVLGGDWLRRSWVVLFPALLYVLWYAAYGHQQSETHLSLWGGSLSYAMQALSATAGSVVGLSSISPQTGTLDLTFGVPIAIALIAAVAAAAWRGWRPRPIFWASAASLVVIWLAASLSNYGVFSRPASDPRYLSSDAMLLLLCVCAALPRPRLARDGTIVACIVLAVIALTNAKQYGQQHGFFLVGSRLQRAELGALDLMRGTVAPTYSPGAVDAELADDTAAPFFSAVDAFGLREDTIAQIRAQPESTRGYVDRILAPNELSLTPTTSARISGDHGLRVLSGSPARRTGCLIVGASALEIAAGAGVISISARRDPSAIAAARFADEPSYGLGSVPAGTNALLSVRGDHAGQIPWRFSLTGTGSRVCAGR